MEPSTSRRPMEPSPSTDSEVTTLARVRQALPCSAHRGDGEPCEAFAIAGGTVCQAHGGTAPQARQAAERRQLEASAQRQFDAAYRRRQREWNAWQARRVAITAERLGLPPGQVTTFAIGICRGLYGVPEGPETEPKSGRTAGTGRGGR